MTEHILTELQYSNDREGPFRLYIYAKNGYHSGGIWVRRVPKYPGEITTQRACTMAVSYCAEGAEVRITDGGDMLVYHAKDNQVLYPAPEEMADAKFWSEFISGKKNGAVKNA